MLCRFTSSAGVNVRLWLLVAGCVSFLAACGEPSPADIGRFGEDSRRDAMQEATAHEAGEVWAMRWTIPVRWNGNIGIEAGKGEVIHYAKSSASMQGNVRTDLVRLCGVQQPAYQLRRIWGNELYQAQYPTEAFDAETLPPRTMTTVMGEAGAFTTAPIPLQLGGAMDNPARGAWPSPTDEYPGTLDTQADGHPGFATTMRTDAPFTRPPVNKWRTRRGDVFHVALRHLVGARGSFSHDGYAAGRAQVGGIAGKAALHMRVVACQTEDGSACTGDELYDVNANAPAYVVTGVGQFVMQRVSADTGCESVRGMVFTP